MTSTQAQPTHVEATFYVQVDPRWKDRYWVDEQGNLVLEGAAAIALTQAKPRKPKAGCVVTMLTLRFPAGAFLPLAPRAVVEIPESLATVIPLEVVAHHPGEITVDDDATDPVV